MFYFPGGSSYLYIILLIMVISNIMTGGVSLLGLLLSLPGVLIAITFHEFAHAFAAVKLGDETPKMQGRLSLNPLKHMDPIGIVMLLFLGFGWGRPVEIDSRNFNRNISVRKAEAIVSIAGPLANFILAIVFSAIYGALIKFNALTSMDTRTALTIITILQSIISINIGLGVFNLIPLPPLDGSKVLSYFLPYNARNWFENNQQIFYIIFLIIWITGIAGTIISPAITSIYYGLMKLVSLVFGL